MKNMLNKERETFDDQIQEIVTEKGRNVIYSIFIPCQSLA